MPVFPGILPPRRDYSGGAGAFSSRRHVMKQFIVKEITKTWDSDNAAHKDGDDEISDRFATEIEGQMKKGYRLLNFTHSMNMVQESKYLFEVIIAVFERKS
jgi:hypothetical protein